MAKRILADPKVASALELFEAWTESQMAYRGQPGLSVGIVHDQSLIWSRGFGCADLDQRGPATPTTIYRIASITKLFTSTSIMQLRDEGALQLDDPLAKHLPWFSIRNPHADRPPVTIRHLLTHAGGLPREAAFPYWSTGEFPEREAIQAALRDQELALPTESDWKYANLGMALAGEIVAAVSGMPYAAYVHKNILQPLRMQNTFVDTIPADHPLLATGYGRRLPGDSRELSPYTDCRGIGPAANMASNVEDLAKFASLQFRSGTRKGPQILAGSTLQEMHRVHWLNADWSAGRGLGFFVWRLGGRTLVGHGGSLRGYRTELQIAPADKVAVIVMTNADDGLPLTYVEKLFQWVVPAIVATAQPATKPLAPEEQWRAYTGRYRSPWGDSQVLIYGGELVLVYPTDPDPLAGMVKLKPHGPHTFRIMTNEHFDNNGELAVFELDESGKVVRLTAGYNYAYPVPGW
jgi:D-alanyl-D-alanine carboxypeptidase